MDLEERDLGLLIRALARHRQPGEAAHVLDLLGRLQAERHRRRVVAADLGPATGRLFSIPGGLDTRAAPR